MSKRGPGLNGEDELSQLQFVIDAAELGTWELNPATNTFKGNARLKEWFGLKPDEEIELSVATNIIAEKDRKRVIDAIAYALKFESGGNYEIDYTIQHPRTGKQTIVKAKGKAYFNEQKQPYTFSGTLQDVTEQSITYQRLQESENRFRQLLQEAPMAACLFIGRDFRVTIANDLMLQSWGKTEAVIGKTFREAMPELEGQPFFDVFDKVFTTGETYNNPEAVAHVEMNGKMVTNYFNYTLKPLRNESGEVYAIVNTHANVTAQVLARKKIEESEARFRSLVEEAPVATCLFVGRKHTVALANDLMLGLWGKSSKVIGMPVEEAIPELKGQPFLQILDDVFTTGKPYSASAARAELAYEGGLRTYYFNFTYKPLFNEAGEVYGIIDMAIDVTEEVLANQEIEQKEKELRDVITASPIGICVVSGIGARIDEVNQQFIFISGKKPEQFVNATYWEVFPEVAEPFSKVMEDVFKTGVKFTTAEAELVLIRKGVPEKMFATFEYIPIFDRNNVVTKIMIMVIEVTHQVETRKAIEEAVVQRTKELAESNLLLRRSNEELEQFAYIASHDLQEPIRKISTFTQMLESDLSHVSEKGKGYISKIYSSTDRMSKLVRDVLAYSRINDESNAFEEVDLNAIIELVKSDFEVPIDETKATINVMGLPKVHAISSQMMQLFGNLMSNALKYRKPGTAPVITISSSIAKQEKVAKRIALDPTKQYHHIAFSDNGIGFDKEHVDKIFRIFQRLHGKTEYEGTGIGLAICLKIVNSHGGHISASVGENGGALFNILLPAKE